jgi:hypothetical protein
MNEILGGKIHGHFSPSFSRFATTCHLLIIVNCFSLKRSVFNKRNNCTFMFDVMLFYISVLCTVVDRERFSVFRVDH